jgi:hypothetical protein
LRASATQDLAPREPPVAQVPASAPADAGSVEPRRERPIVSTKERKNRPAIVNAEPAPPAVDSAPVVAAAAPVPMPPPAVVAPTASASAAPPASHWSLDRDFPAKKASP